LFTDRNGSLWSNERQRWLVTAPQLFSASRSPIAGKGSARYDPLAAFGDSVDTSGDPAGVMVSLNPLRLTSFHPVGMS